MDLTVNGDLWTIKAPNDLFISHENPECSIFTRKDYAPKFGGAWYDEYGEFIYITEVIYHEPAVIVFYSDGTKTTSKKDERDDWNPEMGLVLAVLKKITSGDFVAKLLRDWKPAASFGSLHENSRRTLRDVRKDHKTLGK